MISIPALYRAWQAGQIIRNPAKWKSGSELATAVAIFVSSTVIVLGHFYPVILSWMSEEVQALIVTIIIAGIGILNIITGRITTRKKVGPSVLVKNGSEFAEIGERETDNKIFYPSAELGEIRRSGYQKDPGNE